MVSLENIENPFINSCYFVVYLKHQTTKNECDVYFKIPYFRFYRYFVLIHILFIYNLYIKTKKICKLYITKPNRIYNLLNINVNSTWIYFTLCRETYIYKYRIYFSPLFDIDTFVFVIDFAYLPDIISVFIIIQLFTRIYGTSTRCQRIINNKFLVRISFEKHLPKKKTEKNLRDKFLSTRN